MPIMNQGAAEPSAKSAPPSYQQILAKLTSEGWQVVTEGPSGAQLKWTRKMMTQTRIVLVLGGVCLLFYWPAAIFFIAVATFDYFVFTKERDHFLDRERPTIPGKK